MNSPNRPGSCRTPGTTLMMAFLSCMVVLAILLIVLVVGVWQHTTGLTREAARASYALPELELVQRFTTANASLQSQGLLLDNVQSAEELALRKQALWDSIAATEAILGTGPTGPVMDPQAFSDTLTQIKSVVLGLSLVSATQLSTVDALSSLTTASRDKLDRMIKAVQLRVVALTEDLLVDSDLNTDTGFATNFETISLNIQDYLLFNQDLVRLKAVVERVSLLQQADDIAVAEQQRDLLFRTMVSRAIHIDDENVDALLLAPLDILHLDLRSADSLFATQRNALLYDRWESQISSLLAGKISSLIEMTEQSRVESESILVGTSTNTLASLDQYRLFLVLGLIACLLVLGIISYWLLYRRTVMPLKEITGQLDRVGTHSFSQIKTPYFINEIQSISQAVASLDSAQKSMQKKDQQLNIINRDLRRANEDLEQFARVASHDLQEPLRKLQQFSEILNEDYGESFDEDGTYYLQAISNASQRMSRMIRDTLEYARAAKVDLATESIDVEKLINALCLDMELMISEAGTTVIVDSLPAVMGNRTGLRQLFRNLIINAIKYRRPDEPSQIRISTVFSSIEPVATIVVEDNGIGMEQKDLQRVFAPFERLRTDLVPGTGLGLAICSKVCLAHGWTIEATSELGSGSSFHIRLPTQDIASSSIAKDNTSPTKKPHSSGLIHSLH